MRAFKSLIIALLMLFVTVPAMAWQLSDAKRQEYNGNVSALKMKLEGWLRNIPDDSDGRSYKELARGAFLWALSTKRCKWDCFTAEYFAQADQNQSLDSVELVLGTQKGQVLFWVRQENESCT